MLLFCFFFFSSRRRHTRLQGDWSSDVCSSDLGREVMVLEAAEAIGTGTSSRNSEVIHAGIYYPEGSLKARLCVEGRQRLYAYCGERGIAHQRCGKLIVATDAAQRGQLQAIARKAEANGVHDLRWLEGAEARAMEPALHCAAALHSRSEEHPSELQSPCNLVCR